MSEAKYPEVRVAYRSAREQTVPRLSQERLAEAVGVTRRHLIRIENGDHRPTPQLRDRIAEALGVNPGALPAVEPPPRFQDAA